MTNIKTLQEYLDEQPNALSKMVEQALTESDMLCEMAEIGRVGKFIVYVWTRDGGEIPHFHIGDAATFPRCLQFSTAVKIEVAEYYAHNNNYTDKLSSKQRKQLVDFLNSKTGIGVTKWQLVLEMWNSGVSKHKVSPTQTMPDYTQPLAQESV